VAVGTAEGRGAALGEHADVLLDAPESVPTLLDSLGEGRHDAVAP
jgi:hypothetical protein